MNALEMTIQVALTAAYNVGRTDAIQQFAQLVIEDDHSGVPVSLQRIIAHTIKVLDTKADPPTLVVTDGP